MTSNRKLEIEKIAGQARQKAAVSGDGIGNIFDVCYALGYYSIRYPLGSDAILGASIIKNDDYIVFSNSSNVLSREIFTVAHEIGHIELSHLNSSLTQIEDYSLTSEEGELEREANYFAACFLMPEEKLSTFARININKPFSEWSVLEIANVQSAFKTSFETTLNRLETFGYITLTQKETFLNKKSDIKVSKLLRAVGGSPNLCFPAKVKSVPPEFLKWLTYNYEHDLIPEETFLKALQYLDLNIEDMGIFKDDIEDDSFDLDDYLGGQE